MVWDRAGNPNAKRDGPCWAWVQVQAGGNSWEWWGGKEPAGVVGQLIACSFTTQAAVTMARLPPYDVFNLIFIPEHKPWQQIPACSACAGGVCSTGRSVALDQSKGLEAKHSCCGTECDQ